ncbi:glycoside hydrolase family 81 protein [Fistulina hepatica ATCC 64428]|uniref:glucan endo-1,3-beta-D-glucosidase n=1 Tax=Fistulina hepatica ATCC 64428 TaxID=1128425 RepID=A0A0D7AHX5_9AGAR|nr:glycoside hydrolase family 81 protein [Fistulina hepatica ATCC 64428]
MFSSRCWGALLAFGASALAETFGPIATDAPVPPGGSEVCAATPNTFFANFTPPFPTNGWWAGYGAGDGDEVCAGPFPYETSLTATAIQYGISTDRNFDGVSIHEPTQTDWTVGFTEHSGNSSDHKAFSWDTQTVTLQYFTGSSTLTSYMVPGSPYLTFQFSNATPVFTSGQGLITSFANTTLGSGDSLNATASEFLVDNDIGTYIIYSLSGDITLTATGSGTVTASEPFTGVLRTVKLNETSHQPLLDAHASTYPTAATTDYAFSGDTAILSFTWDVVGNASDLLMLTWPHHRLTMLSPDFPDPSSLNYITTKGYMYPALGNEWNMLYNLSTITWNAPRPIDSSCTSSISAGVEYEIANLPAVSAPADFYYFGVNAGMVSRLALIADDVGRTDLVATVVDYLEDLYVYWFNSSSAILAAYETGWGGIINNQGYDNVNVDFGNGYYNDHHFHYGYYLAGAAVIAKYDTDWMNEHLDYFNYFLRDIVNPSTEDPYFPIARCRDWFAGHSWASGIANGAGSRDQESSGEAINGYYGSLLWANITGNSDIVDYARLLLATEQHGAQVYWHLYPEANGSARDQPYPEQDVRDLVTMGNVEDWQSGAWLFWGDEQIEIAAIQMLPVTPVNEYLYDVAWVENVWSYALDEILDPSYDDEWKCVIYCAYSQANLSEAATMSSSLTTWGTGNSYSNQMYFLATREGASGVCSSLPANPLGNYVFQSTSTDLYISNASLPNLYAIESDVSAAAVFNLSFAPNMGTIYALENDQYVTADDTGTYALSAARSVASTWELYMIRQQEGAESGVYTILANANSAYLIVESDGAVVNNATNVTSAEGFRLISV